MIQFLGEDGFLSHTQWCLTYSCLCALGITPGSAQRLICGASIFTGLAIELSALTPVLPLYSSNFEGGASLSHF